MTTANFHPDDFCRACKGTGKEIEIQDREGRKVHVTGPCYACKGVGTKLIVFGVAQ